MPTLTPFAVASSEPTAMLTVCVPDGIVTAETRSCLTRMNEGPIDSAIQFSRWPE